MAAKPTVGTAGLGTSAVSEDRKKALEHIAASADFTWNAKLKDMRGSQAGPGKWNAFERDAVLKKLRDHGVAQGFAGNLAWIDLKKPALRGQTPSLLEIKKTGDEEFDVPTAMQSGCIDWKQPVVVAIFSLDDDEFQVDKFSSPKGGALRKLSMDVSIAAFNDKLKFWIEMEKKKTSSKTTSTTEAAMKIFSQGILHCPMTFVYMAPGPDLDKRLFAKAFQTMEDFRKVSDDYAPSGWQVCASFAEVRDMHIAEAGDAGCNAGVEDFFIHSISFAASSDYGFKRKDKSSKKVTENHLWIYDSFKRAQADMLLADAKGEFGTQHQYHQVTKLLTLVQRSNKDPAKLLFLVQASYFRLRRRLTEPDISKPALAAELKCLCVLYDVTRCVPQNLGFEVSSAEFKVLAKMRDPVHVPEVLSDRETIGMLRQSAQKLVHTLEDAYCSNMEAVLQEMHDNVGGSWTSLQKLMYPKLGLAGILEDMAKERQVIDATARLAAVPTPHEVEIPAAPTTEVDDNEADEGSEEVKLKEDIIKEERLKHAEKVAGSIVPIRVAPVDKDGSMANDGNPFGSLNRFLCSRLCANRAVAL